MSLPRFSGEVLSVLSSAMLSRNLRFNFQPRLLWPSQLLVESLVLQLVRLYEAPEVHNCKIGKSMFSMDILAGFNSVLLLRLLGFSA
jgi:hypothetical protein